MVSSFGQRFGAKLLFLSLFNQLVMRSFCFSFAGSRFVGHCRGVRKQPSNVRCFSGLDDLMGEVDQLLSDLSSGNKHTAATASENDGWTNYDWTTLNIWTTKPSPVEERMILGRRVFVKRDDLLRLRGSNISGNKARKMLTLNEIPADEFPECLVSYGGPQSNSMLALAAVINYKNRELVLEGDESCFNGPASTSQLTPSKESADAGSTKEKRFVYYTKKLPRFLRNQPSGNLFRANTLGMELIEVSRQEYNDLFDSDSGASPRPPLGLDPPLPGNSMWVPQGGAFGMALGGATVLAREIFSYWSEHGNGRTLSVCVPGGTCSTALLLHHEMKKLLQSGNKSVQPLDIEIVVIPCVGDALYARRQMMSLSSQIGAAADDIPSILNPSPDEYNTSGSSSEKQLKYFTFGEPNKDILETFKTMRDDHKLVLDLIYGAVAWTILLRHWNTQLSYDLTFDPYNPIAGREIMYVHSGGLEGINSQLLRYKHKGLVELEDIQLPGKDR